MWTTDPLIENNDSVTYQFNQDISPLSDFDVHVDERIDTSREKMQTHGLWPTFVYRGGMTITMSGSILADSRTNYVIHRNQMVRALFGDNYNDLVSVETMGTFRMQPIGESEIWEVGYVTQDFDAPLTWTQGAYSLFQVTLFCFQPYFTGATTPTNTYRWA